MNFKFLATTAVLLGLFFTSKHSVAADVSIQLLGQVLPGVYGQVVFSEPVERYSRTHRYYDEPVQVVYIEVPHQHRRHWHKHCRSYRACQQKVYFVEPRVVEHRHYRAEKRRGRERHHHHH